MKHFEEVEIEKLIKASEHTAGQEIGGYAAVLAQLAIARCLLAIAERLERIALVAEVFEEHRK